MNQFIKRIIKFITILIFFGLLALLSLNLLVNTNYKIKSDKSTIFIGDSHIENAINDSIIPHSKNMGSNSEFFYFSYYKLKQLLKDNPTIKQVYLCFSFHSLSSYYDDAVISGEYSPFIASRYYFSFPIKEQIRLIYWNKNNLPFFIKTVIKTGIKQSLENEFRPFIGSFSNNFNETNAIDSIMDNRLLHIYYENDRLKSFSEINIHYFNEIIKLCKKEGVDFTVVNTPINEYLLKKIPNKYKNKLNELVKTNQLNYIDLSNLELSDNCFFSDGDHVSSLGAEKTSLKLKEIIDKRTTIYK